MANHSDRGSARVPGGYDNYDYGDQRGYGDGPVSPAPAAGNAWGDGYDYGDSARNHAEPASGRASVPMNAMSVQPDDGYDYEPQTATGRATVGKRRAEGRASVTGPRSKPSDDELAERKKRLKKKKRIRRWAIFGCVVAMLAGVGTVGVTVFWSDVPLPDKLQLATASTVMYSDGKTEMAGLGSEFRVDVDYATLPEHVKYAVIAAEDQTFYENPGVDFKGVMRAFWNNVTGGETQGASTITQQYAGIAANMRDEATYGRKAREAVIAMKLDDEYTKDQILGFYLDVVFMGRGAYGIGAASLAFFNKPITKVTPAEAALLAGQIKSPDGSFDPEDPMEIGNGDMAMDRYHYVLDSMLKLGKITQEDYAAAYPDFPKTQPVTSNAASRGAATPTGYISHGAVLDELLARYGITEQMLNGNKDPDDPDSRNTIANVGGYKITTTINKKMQKAAEKYASRNSKKSIMHSQPKNEVAALVAIDPKTGAVMAYYGGSDNEKGPGTDKAGVDLHPMGSAFKIFTLSTAVSMGASVDSYWNGSSPRAFPGRAADNPVVNSGDGRGAQCAYCTLTTEVRQSLNTPMYAIAEKYGAEAVTEQAYKMGITQLEDQNGDVHQLKDVDMSASREFFDKEIAFGQYAASVRDMAAGAGTIANLGLHVETHVIAKVEKNGEEILPKQDLTQTQAMAQDVAADVTSVLGTGIMPSIGPAFGGNGNRPTASKTGTWERDCVGDKQKPACVDGQNSNTAYVGYTPQLSTAVWVGDKSTDNGKVVDANGSELYGSMTAGTIWKNFMESALEGAEVLQFPAKVGTGDVNAGDAVKPKGKECDPIDELLGKCKSTGTDPSNPGHGHDNTVGTTPDSTTDDNLGGAGGGTGSAPYATTETVHSGQDSGVPYGSSVLPYAVFQREYSISNN